MRARGARCLLLVLLIGCGGGGASTDGSTDEDTSGGENGHHGRQSARELLGINPPETPWAEMSHGDREMDMVGRFLPIFKEMFQEYDGDEYEHFGCESCHGEDMRERNFEMPSPRLPVVPAVGSDEYRAMAEANPQITVFMVSDVTPTMGTMLGMSDTFTCNGCHPSAEEAEEEERPRRHRRRRRHR